jgi:transketolase
VLFFFIVPSAAGRVSSGRRHFEEEIMSTEKKTPTPEQLEEAARRMRALDITSIHAAGSGHPGGTLSIMDVLTVLYLDEITYDPENPKWEGRDRVFLSAGHKAPALYAALSAAGLYPEDDLVLLRSLGSPFQGHPHAPKLPGIEVSSGSLGQGLGIAVGSALAARFAAEPYRVYCIMGDGEQQEGSIWEAAMTAGHYRLANLCGIVDRNSLQIDGRVEEVMNVSPLADKYRAFGWHTVEIDGHDLEAIRGAFAEARKVTDRPTVIIANTVKGKGVSFMEDQAGWHGIATKSEDQLERALDDIGCAGLCTSEAHRLLERAGEYKAGKRREIAAQVPRFGDVYRWNESDTTQVELEPTRFGFGRCLSDIGSDPRIVTIHADISGSIKISDFEKDHPERLDRVFSVGIAEQNMMQVAAGFALEGKIPITGTYGVFASGRPWDQIRTTICYDNLNVKIAGAHGGISVGADGATHQALEEISLMTILPNMSLCVPCDSVETERLSGIAITEVVGPAYIRFAREATPMVTGSATPLQWGKANVVRYRGRRGRFSECFETLLAADYPGEGEDIALVACGPMVTEAMRAALVLKEQFDIETRVLNVHTVKPIDEAALIAAAQDTGAVITCEEHQVGGFGNIVAGAIGRLKDSTMPFALDQIGVKDRFGESGDPWDLMAEFGLTAEHIVEASGRLLKRK